MIKVRVRGYGMHYVNKCPHKDIKTSITMLHCLAHRKETKVCPLVSPTVFCNHSLSQKKKEKKEEKKHICVSEYQNVAFLGSQSKLKTSLLFPL